VNLAINLGNGTNSLKIADISRVSKLTGDRTSE
jgi:hypothetical protein